MDVIKKRDNLKYILIYGALIGLYQIVMKEYYGDTLAYFARAIQDMNMSSLLAELYIRYMSWTSRILIELPLFILAHGMHMVLFGIANWLVHIMLLLSLMRLTDYKHNRVLTCLMLMYPVALMAGSGWMTAYITYFWPLSFGITAMVSLKKMFDGAKVGIIEGVFYLLCLIFAVDLEVCAVFYTCILATFCFLMFWDKKFSSKYVVYTALQLVMCTCGIVFALTCPGNEARKISNITFWFPNYTSFTVIDKAVLGVNSAFINLYTHDVFWFVLCFVVCALTLAKNKDNIILMIEGVVPFTFIIFWNILKNFVYGYYPEIVDLFEAFDKNKYVDSTNYNSPAVYIPFVIYMFLIVMLLLSILNLFNDERKGFLACAIIVSGIISRLTLGFSPTVFTSGKRTFIFADFAIIFVLLLMAEAFVPEIKKDNEKVLVLCRSLMVIATGFVVLANFVAVCSVYLY
ncbi:hypothetical protein SAMN02745247_02792 [Butyrivibrio hungatei DSM 14810]|uniref:EpsG family protein n=1 Tax=Butyrivibrio hungatei DSM 14810 TaxID=1121132 RepID=A0A1M7T0S2_9FIRM|nr:hypothetical protein [Butyrivibrio hungatei]SHN64336.1 hypothetical protein SAMN02745247_02792 [Butyrivibrio hungatei DSM 14810]